MCDTTRKALIIDKIRQPKFVTFEDAEHGDERVAAILIAKDVETGRLKAYTKDVPGHADPDPELVLALVQSQEIRDL